MKYESFGTSRIKAANRYFNDWEDLFRCKTLEEYYEGFQHRLLNTTNLNGLLRPYSLNVIYAAIQTKMANMILNNPQFEVTAKPRFSDWDQEMAYASSNIKQDALNTIIENPNINFVDNIKLAALDYFFRFSVIEVGYASDWQNPNTPAPATVNDFRSPDDLVDEDKDKIKEEFELPLDESIFFKRIPAYRFRVSLADSPQLKNCAWAGYYSYFYKEVLDKMDGISYRETYQQTQTPSFSAEYRGPSRIVGSGIGEETEDPELKYLIRTNEVVKMWTIWNNKIKKKCLVHDSTGAVCWQDDFHYIPLATNRANYRAKGWYPIPPTWYWLSPQDEINEAREQMRNYRRRYKRKFFYIKGKVTTTELDKLASDEDGAAIEIKEQGAIGGIGNPEIGVTIESDLAQSHADFNLITGTSQARESDRETATKSKIIALKENVRENIERQNFDAFICEAGRLGLVVMSERLTLPMWIKYTVDPSENFLGEVNDKGPAYRLIQAQHLDDGYDFTVAIKVVDASDSQMEAELQKFITFMGMCNQFPQIMLSPTLIREAAYKCGYRNEKAIREMQKAALLHQMGQMAQMQQMAGLGGGGGTGPGMNNGNANKSSIQNGRPQPVEQMNQRFNGQQ